MRVEYYCIVCKVGCRPKCSLALIHNKMGDKELSGGVVVYLCKNIPTRVDIHQREKFLLLDIIVQN